MADRDDARLAAGRRCARRSTAARSTIWRADQHRVDALVRAAPRGRPCPSISMVNAVGSPPAAARAGWRTGRPAGPACCACRRPPGCRSGPSCRPRPSRLPPPPPSSAGWKMTTAVPSKLRVSARYLRRAEQHGRVPVVAAGVHLARRLSRRRAGRSPRRSAARPCRRAGRSPCPTRALRRWMTPTTPVRPMPGHHLVAAEGLELVGDDARPCGARRRGAPGCCVDVAPPGGDLVLHVGDAVDDGHGGSLELLGAERKSRGDVIIASMSARQEDSPRGSRQPPR